MRSQQPAPANGAGQAGAASTARAAVPSTSASSVIRASGVIQAREWQSVRVPQLSGVAGFQFTLTSLIPNGSKVTKGTVLAEFDRLTLLDQEREAVAQLENLEHQLAERKAQVLSQQATRGSQIREAQADLDRAQIQLRIREVLADLDRMKNEAKAETARLRLASLNRSDAFRTKSEEASIRVLELKLQRQRVTLERLRTNLERLVLRAGLDGMIVHESVYRQGSMGPPQVGDRVWQNLPLMRIFNPERMVVEVTVDEPDFRSVADSAKAKVYLDAYPAEVFDATMEYASPVASTGLDSTVRSFLATFRIHQQSPRLLPDLSAALEIPVPPSSRTTGVETARRRAPEVRP